MSKSVSDIYNDAVKQADADQFEEAIETLKPVTELTPLLRAAYTQRGRCHWEMHRWDEARESFETAVRIEPDNADAWWSLGLIALQQGDFETGWKGYERRWESEAFKSPKLVTKLPRWCIGRDLDGEGYKSVLVWPEQGIGDQLIYSSLLRELQHHCEKVTVMIDVRLIGLLKRATPWINFVKHDAKLKNSEFDSQIPIASIGSHFIKTAKDIPELVSTNYIEADPKRVEQIKQELGIKPEDFVIGLSWASTAEKIGPHKSVKLEELVGLWDIPNVKIVSLQYGKPDYDIEPFEAKTGKKIHQCMVNNFFDLEGTAAIMSLCNAVVSVSNANVHLAGALGKPVYVLDANKLWYWNHKHINTSLFYPSVKLFPREHMLAPWTNQIEAIIKELRRN